MHGLILGFSIAAPVGPIGILCIHRTLNSGRLHGFVSGLGAATADAIYGTIAAFGLAVIANFLTAQVNVLRLAGGVFLCYLGLKALLATASNDTVSTSSAPLASAYASTFILTLTNPLTILSFAAIFAGLGLAEVERGYLSGTLLVLGVFTGSGLWWLLLSSSVGLFRDKFDARRLRWVNRVAGVIIGGFGLIMLLAYFR
jgi:threonine/homoserine/homoserine lactone efflux protein